MVRSSSQVSQFNASCADSPHISCVGRKETQTAGRSGRPKSLHRPTSSNWRHRTPAGFPSGMPGIGEEIDSAMQHAAHPIRHSTLDHLRRLRDAKTGLNSPRREWVQASSLSQPLPGIFRLAWAAACTQSVSRFSKRPGVRCSRVVWVSCTRAVPSRIRSCTAPSRHSTS
jgi:hypothetical protein